MEQQKRVWQIIRYPRAWTKSIVRSISRQYKEVSDADIDIVLWVVTCYLKWTGTRVNKHRVTVWRCTIRTSEHLTRVLLDGVYVDPGVDVDTQSKRKIAALPRIEPWSSSNSVPMLSTLATVNAINLRASDAKRRSIWMKSFFYTQRTRTNLKEHSDYINT